jgi:hypothetical protein
MPEVIKTLQRALERIVEDGLDAEESPTAALLLPPSPQQEDDNVLSVKTGASRRSADTLDHEFIETGIDALRRPSTRPSELDVTRFEIDLKAAWVWVFW